MAKIIYRQMLAPRDVFQQILAPGQKLGCKSPRVGANFWCKSPGVHAGGMVMDEIDTCIMTMCTFQIFFCGGLQVGGLRMCHPPYHPPWFSKQN